jgi:hypothetical protein
VPPGNPPAPARHRAGTSPVTTTATITTAMGRNRPAARNGDGAQQAGGQDLSATDATDLQNDADSLVSDLFSLSQSAGAGASGSSGALSGTVPSASPAATPSAGASTNAFGNSELQTIVSRFAQDLITATQAYASQNPNAPGAKPTVTTVV